MINYKEFEILKALMKGNEITAEEIYKSVHHKVYMNVDEVKNLLNSLSKRQYIRDGHLTEFAYEEIQPCKVENAVILAAGGDDISSKSIYSMPKGLFMKNGETLIERQIRQLREAGINDITVVIAYKQELYFYLQDKWNVNLEINPDLKKNNIYSLYIVRNKLSNTYILNCDNYFEENPFSLYEFNSFHATVYKDDASNELLINKNDSGRITSVYSGSKSGECIYGHAYLDKEFSLRFIKYLEGEIEDFRINKLFWEEFVYRHIDNLDFYAHEYSSDFVYEFDQIQQIQNIEGLFLSNISSKINSKICDILKCKENDVSDIEILEKGLTNILFTFVVKGEKFIFRYPGDSSHFFIYRKNECVAQKLASKSHADDTYVYIDETGVKISKFRENCIDLHGIYYEDIDVMKRIARKIGQFHREGYNLPNSEEYNYDPIYQCERLFKEASKVKGDMFTLFAKEWETMRKLQSYADLDGIKHTMCHNDINIDNVLMTADTLDIIDWEFAGFNDPGYDFGRVIAGFTYEPDDSRIDQILEAYFERPATSNEKLHWMAYSAIHNWYYVGWALYKESINESSRDWMLFFYKQAKKLAAWCMPKYEEKYGKI